MLMHRQGPETASPKPSSRYASTQNSNNSHQADHHRDSIGVGLVSVIHFPYLSYRVLYFVFAVSDHSHNGSWYRINI